MREPKSLGNAAARLAVHALKTHFLDAGPINFAQECKHPRFLPGARRAIE